MAESKSQVVAKKALKKLEDQLTCAVCLEDFKHPKLLQCFHVYCKDCLKPLVVQDKQGQRSLRCPTCRQSTLLPPGSTVSDLQPAFHIHHLLEIQEALEKLKEPQKVQCDKCKLTPRPATSYCRDCGEFICAMCTTVHREWQTLSEHEVVALEQLESRVKQVDALKKVTLFCSLHNSKELELYCETFEELICHNCTIKKHKEHRYDLVSDTFETHKTEITASMKPIERHLSVVNKSLEELKGRANELSNQRASNEAKIQREIQQLHELIEARKAKLIRQNDQMIEIKLKNLSAQEDELETLQTQLVSCLSFMRESLRTGSQGEVMKMKKTAMKQMKKMTDNFKPDSLRPCEAANVKFMASGPNLTHACQKFGRVVLQKHSPKNCYATGIVKKVRVDERVTAVLHVVDDEGKACTTPVETPTCELVPVVAGKRKNCLVKKVAPSQYEITYQPTIRGRYQLHIKVEGGHIKRSPFSVAVKDLNNLVQIIEQVKEATYIILDETGNMVVAEAGLHAEVWVATKEDSVACIEVVDVLARPPKVRQRFTLKPKTPHIVCMRSIPGIIEQSRDFANSSVHTHKTDWVSASLFTGSASSSSPSYLVQRRFSDSRARLRPKSASFTASRENGGFLLASTPDLSSMSGYSEAAVPVDIDLFSSTSPESPLTPARNRKSLRRTGSDSPTTMLKTINEVPLASASDSAIKRDENSGDDPLQSEEGSSSSLRSGESEIEMTDGLFSFGKRNNRKTPQSGGLQNGNQSPGIGTENVMTSTPRDPKTKSKLEFTHSPPPPKKNDSLTRSAEWMHFSEPAGTYASGKLRDKFSDYSQGPIPEVSITNEESQDGKTGERKYTDGKSPVMWIITEDNTLYFYPTTDPSHRPINHVQLRSRATCMEYICGKVFVGHIASAVSVYHKDEFSPSWDIENPEIITLPSFNPEVQNDVRCIAAVKDRVWVGAGPSIFFLSAENLQREGSRFLNSWHYPPDHILPLGEVVAVSTKGSSLFIFDAESANILRKFDVYPMTKQLEIVEENSKWRDPKKTSKWNDRSVIKTMVADENNMLYVGTSSGMVVAIPIDSLKKGVPVTNGHVTNGFEDTDAAREEILKRELKLAVTSESFKGEKKSEESASEETDSGGGSRNSSGLLDEPESVYLDNCALALHIQKDSRVRSLLHLKLPLKPPSNLNSPSPSETGALYHSLPNLNSSFGSRMSISPPILSYRSLIISAGKGHMEYSEDPEPEDNGVLPTNYNALRERNEAYQLLVWGHRNAAKYQYN